MIAEQSAWLIASGLSIVLVLFALAWMYGGKGKGKQ